MSPCWSPQSREFSHVTRLGLLQSCVSFQSLSCSVFGVGLVRGMALCILCVCPPQWREGSLLHQDLSLSWTLAVGVDLCFEFKNQSSHRQFRHSLASVLYSCNSNSEKSLAFTVFLFMLFLCSVLRAAWGCQVTWFAFRPSSLRGHRRFYARFPEILWAGRTEISKPIYDTHMPCCLSCPFFLYLEFLSILTILHLVCYRFCHLLAKCTEYCYPLNFTSETSICLLKHWRLLYVTVIFPNEPLSYYPFVPPKSYIVNFTVIQTSLILSVWTLAF